MSVLVCAHRWGEPFQVDDKTIQICKGCGTLISFGDPEPRVILGKIENE